MNEELEKKYINADVKTLQELLKNDSDTLTDEEYYYIKDLLREKEKMKKEKQKQLFQETDSIPIDNNVAIVLDIDETLIRRSIVEKTEDSAESMWILARPGLFELLDGLKEMKEQYQIQHPGKEFNLYIFTSSPTLGAEMFKDFLGEKYCELFKDFFHRDSDIYNNNGKNVHLLPEDTILYFADQNDATNVFRNCSDKTRENQKIIAFDITPFTSSNFEYAIQFREFNRHLHSKVQEMIKEKHPNSSQYKATLDELSVELLNYYDTLNKKDRIDILLDKISSQLTGKNNDTINATDGKSANKLINIPSVNYKLSRGLFSKYCLFFEEIYGEEQGKTKIQEIQQSVKPILQKSTSDNAFEDPKNRAKYHPAEIYRHSKRYMNDDIGEIE